MARTNLFRQWDKVRKSIERQGYQLEKEWTVEGKITQIFENKIRKTTAYLELLLFEDIPKRFHLITDDAKLKVEGVWKEVWK